MALFGCYVWLHSHSIAGVDVFLMTRDMTWRVEQRSSTTFFDKVLFDPCQSHRHRHHTRDSVGGLFYMTGCVSVIVLLPNISQR